MKNKLICGITGLCMLVPTTAMAGTATYVTTGGKTTVVGVDTMVGSMQVGTSVATYADGAVRNESWTCIGTSQPPNAKIFDLHFICDVQSKDGNYTINFGCQSLNANGLQGCVGGLTGKTGAYAKKSGATTWSGTNGSGVGTTQWLD